MQFQSLNMADKVPGSKYFTWGEALWMPQFNAYAKPTDVQKANIARQAAALDRVREHFGRPLNIHCWLRTPEYNAHVGGATHSMHLVGLATDFDVSDLSCDEVKRALRADHSIYTGRGEIDTTNWIHLDLKGSDWFYAKAPTR